MQSPELHLMTLDLVRSDRARKAAHVQQMPGTSVLSTVRISAGNALVAIGHRIAQEPRPTSNRLPSGEITLAATTRR